AAGLMHRLDREWLWVAPADGAFAFGLVPGDDGAQALRALQAQTPAGDDRPVYAGSVLVGALPAGCLAWSPLSAFTQLRPPLPVHPSAFALAGGLALREEDR
ncbi:TPA: pilus assembly protein HofM, partial [Serratia marcescens]